MAGEQLAEEIELHFYPNPVHEVVRFDYEGEGLFERLTVYDLLGRALMTLPLTDATTIQLPAGRLTSGAYVFELDGRKGKARQLLVKR